MKTLVSMATTTVVYCSTPIVKAPLVKIWTGVLYDNGCNFAVRDISWIQPCCSWSTARRTLYATLLCSLWLKNLVHSHRIVRIQSDVWGKMNRKWTKNEQKTKRCFVVFSEYEYAVARQNMNYQSDISLSGSKVSIMQHVWKVLLDT